MAARRRLFSSLRGLATTAHRAAAFSTKAAAAGGNGKPRRSWVTVAHLVREELQRQSEAASALVAKMAEEWRHALAEVKKADEVYNAEDEVAERAERIAARVVALLKEKAQAQEEESAAEN